MTQRPGASFAAIPRTVWVLGIVSLLMDVSSEIVHALLPLFLTIEIGVSVAMLGLIDGIAEATAAITKLFSGYVSDRFGRRKPLILMGYGLAAATKPFFALAGSAGMVFGARFADRIGKGLRGAPRDALIVDVTPANLRGHAFGLRQSLDTVGAFAGPLLAIGLMIGFANNIRAVFWFATIPAALAVLLIIFCVHDRPRQSAATSRAAPFQIAELAALPRAFWMVVILGFVLTLARFSESFLILKASATGLPLALAPLVLVVMNLVYAAGAYPAGGLADRLSAKHLLIAGIGLLIAADLVLASATGLGGVAAGLILWGAHMAMAQGLLAKLIADHAPLSHRGSAFGLFNLATGLALLLASLVAGLLWDAYGAAATFFAGASFAVVALVLASLYPSSAQYERI